MFFCVLRESKEGVLVDVRCDNRKGVIKFSYVPLIYCVGDCRRGLRGWWGILHIRL